LHVKSRKTATKASKKAAKKPGAKKTKSSAADLAADRRDLVVRGDRVAVQRRLDRAPAAAEMLR
jgi:hypothetical protein